MLFFRFILYVWLLVCTHVCTVCVPGAWGNQKVLDSLAVEFCMAWVTVWILGTESGSSLRTSSLSHWDISPASSLCLLSLVLITHGTLPMISKSTFPPNSYSCHPENSKLGRACELSLVKRSGWEGLWLSPQSVTYSFKNCIFYMLAVTCHGAHVEVSG